MKKSTKRSVINTLVLVIVLLAAASYYFLNFLPHEKKLSDTGRARLFPGLVKEDVTGLSIKAGKSEMDCDAVSNIFVMRKPPAGEANQEALKIVLSDLQNLVSESVLSNISAEKYYEYGLDKPAAVIKLKLSDSGVLELDVGSKTPVGDMYYACVKDSPGLVYLVYDYKFKNMERPVDDFRGRDIFTINPDEVGRVEISKKGPAGNLTYTYSRSGGMKIFKEKLLSLYTLYASSFYDGPADDPALERYGFKNPAYAVRISGQGAAAQGLLIGGRQANGSWAGYIPLKHEIIFIDAPDLENILNFSKEN